MRLWHGRELSVRPSGCPFLWGMGEGCMATMRSAMCISSGSRALGWLVQISASVSWEETGSGFSYGWGVWITATGQHCWNKVCLGSSVYACAKCVCGCVFVRVCALCVRCVCGVLFVSRVFSQRRFTEYVLPPLATLPCGGIKEGERDGVGKSFTPPTPKVIF